MVGRELRNFQHLSFEKGEAVFHAGDPGKHAYLINSGAIKLYKMESGKQEVLGYMKPGQVLGEMAIITGAPRTASAEALETTEVLVVDESVLRSVLSRCLPYAPKPLLLKGFARFSAAADSKLHPPSSLDNLQSD